MVLQMFAALSSCFKVLLLSADWSASGSRLTGTIRVSGLAVLRGLVPVLDDYIN